MIVQDASGYVGRPMPIAMQAKLLDQFGPDRVLYKPEASPIGPSSPNCAMPRADGRRVFEGTGGIALVDSSGAASSARCRVRFDSRPGPALARAADRGDTAKADRIHGPLAALVSMQTSLDAFLAVEKHLLVRQGIFKNTLVRGPVGFRLDEETRREVDRLFDRMIEAASDPNSGIVS